MSVRSKDREGAIHHRSSEKEPLRFGQRGELCKNEEKARR